MATTGLIDFERDALAETFGRIALAAGVVVMKVYAGAAHARLKSDSSPVCDADEQAESLILSELAAQCPGTPVIAEEAVARGVLPECGDRFILVDPLDGTREFLARNGEFTVNLALISAGAPIVGAVYAPALEKLWLGGASASACAVAPGAELPSRTARRTIQTRAPKEGDLVAMVSRSNFDAETEAFLARERIARRKDAGSSLKFCVLAEGEADVYPRFGPTMEWDVAAGDAVLRAAGGCVLDAEGRPMRYGRKQQGFRNGPFVAWGRRPA